MDFLKAKGKIFTIIVILTMFCSLQVAAQKMFTSKNIKVNLFSSTPIEDIKAVSNAGTGVIITATKEVAFQLPVKSLQFEKELMQEHFNESYVESDKYPYAKFKGLIIDDIDLKKPGTYQVNVKGKLTVHGVEQDRTIKGMLKINPDGAYLESAFTVKCVDHKIKIPKIVFAKIAEVIQIKVSGNLSPQP